MITTRSMRIRCHLSQTTVETGPNDSEQHAHGARKNSERRKKRLRGAKLSVPKANLRPMMRELTIWRETKPDTLRFGSATSPMSGLSHRPAITASRPASMRLAIAISPSRDKSSTDPISRKYKRTGSSVLADGCELLPLAGAGRLSCTSLKAGGCSTF
jgi:hypothetical protein